MINQLVLPTVLAMYMRIVWTKEIRNSKFELFSTTVFWLELEGRNSKFELFSTTVFWLELEGRQKERKVGEEKRREEKTILYFFFKGKKKDCLEFRIGVLNSNMSYPIM